MRMMGGGEMLSVEVVRRRVHARQVGERIDEALVDEPQERVDVARVARAAAAARRHRWRRRRRRRQRRRRKLLDSRAIWRAFTVCQRFVGTRCGVLAVDK